jgi:MerR family copper efflux transcriptional regulator
MKYTLEEIKANLQQWSKVSPDDTVRDKLTSIQIHLEQLMKEAKELGPIIQQLKPNQMKKLSRILTQPTAACIEALIVLLGKNPFS